MIGTDLGSGMLAMLQVHEEDWDHNNLINSGIKQANFRHQ